MKRRLRLGMVGGGQGAFIGAVHRIAARIDDQYELVAGSLSSDPDRSVSSAAALGVERSYTDYHDMARAESERSDGIDVVSIVTPNYLHAPVATAFLNAGIHVICDKPLAISLTEGLALAKLAKEKNLLFALTHTYSGYPMVRHARSMIAEGVLGEIRLVQVEYAQDWLAKDLASMDNKQAIWRADPELSGPAGCLGDIGTHAYQLACFVTDMLPSQLTADLHTFVPNRRLDDHVQMLLRYENGARGILWASQVASGEENNLKLRVYGSKASLSFSQQTPNELWFTPQAGAAQRLTTGRVFSKAATHATRLPAGHPEGYLEAFAQLYLDAALVIHAMNDNQPNPPETTELTTVLDGVAGHYFMDAVFKSHAQGGGWVDLVRDTVL